MEPSFTTQAEEALDEEARDFAALLRQRAARQALTARGEPVEVTASDVLQAREELVRKEREKKDERVERLRILSGTLGLLILATSVVLSLDSTSGIGGGSRILPLSLMVYGLALAGFSYYEKAFQRVAHHFLKDSDTKDDRLGTPYSD